MDLDNVYREKSNRPPESTHLIRYLFTNFYCVLSIIVCVRDGEVGLDKQSKGRNHIY